MTTNLRRTLAAAIGLALTLTACGSGGSQKVTEGLAGAPASISHVHGLGIDAAGVLHVATHFGLIKQSSGGGWVYASNDRNDHMGFSLQPDAGVMYRSGHSQDRPSLGVESSADGSRWTHLSDVADPAVDFHAMAVSFAEGNNLWGWDSGGRGTFASTDSGKSWTALTTTGIEPQIYVLSGSASPNVVYAGTATGLYRSTDGGSAWSGVKGLGVGWAGAIGADPKDERHLVVFTQAGMKSSVDGGATWTAAGGGLPTGTTITSLAISPVDDTIAYAADSSNVFESRDAGKTWTLMTTS